ncbi:MAG TPA: hypothetical protein VFZ22_06385 [Pyrinomonadaceae bacterium]|nr:hypothetical protein [Pyrinomonadaceae bacterium]
MAQSPESVQIQATVGNVAAGAQLAFGTKIVQIGHVSGGIVNILNEAPPPPRLKPQPVSLRPKPFRDLLDRVTETTDIGNALESQESVECIGESGYGKTSLLRHLAHQTQLSTFAAGVVYFQVNQQSDADLLKSLFDAFYTCDFPIKPTETEIRSYLQSVNALILLDDVGIGAEQIKTLINNAPNCTFIVANKERSLFGETREVTLKGLPVADAVRLFRRELGRELSAEEEKQAQLLCESVDCVPLPILRAAHKVREEKRSLAAVVEEPQAVLAAAEIEPCTQDEKKVLAALAVFRGAPVAAVHIASIAEVPAAQQALDDLEQRGLVQSHEQLYTLASDVTANMLGDPTPWFKRALAHFVSWTEQKRSKPELIAGSAQAILLVLQWAVTNHSWSEVNQLGHASEEALALSGKWDMWATVLESVEAAAAAQKDLAETAWSLHQLGTRALLLDNRSTARASLRQALAIREQLNDQTGAAITRHNLNLLLGPAPPSKPDSENGDAGPTPGAKPFWLKVGAIGLVGLAALIALVVWLFKPSNGPVILPRVLSFSVTPDLVPANGEAQLCYEVANAERVVIEPNIGERRPATKECLPITAGETTTYTLTVFGPNGSTTSQNVVLNVEPPAPKAEIVRFEVLRNNGPGGGADVQFQLCYDVRNAAHAEIDNEVGAIVLGQDRCQQIKPQQTTTYTLTATGNDGRSVTRQATVDATKPPAPLPEILSFDAPETIKSNESAELCFQVKDATTAQIDPGVRQVSITSNRQCVKVRPSQTTKYTLTAFNAEGKEASKDKTITVVYPPTIVSFKTDTNDVRPGDTIKMCYQVENARRLQVDNGVGEVKPADEGCFETTIGARANVTVDEVKSFTLTAIGPDGQTSTGDLKIRLLQQAVEITEFTVNPQRITRGDSVSLCYRTENASVISIEPRAVRQRAQNGRLVCIQHKPAATTTYTLTALNSLGVTAPTRQATVTVDEPKPKHVRIASFSALPPQIKPGQSVQLCYGVADARSITISPFAKEFFNSDKNCFDHSPRRSLTYVLKATGEDGQTETREARVEVERVITPPVRILRFAILRSEANFPAAVIMRLCYTVENAQSARIDPDVGELTKLPTDCLALNSLKPEYTLTATGADGSTVHATATYPPSDRRLVPRTRPRPRPSPGNLLR